MKNIKCEKLERLGYQLTDTQEFLGLSGEEMEVIDLKISLIQKLKELRKASRLTQKQLSKLMKTSQSRVAMLEGGAAGASLELVCKALFVLGATTKDIGKTIALKRAA